MTHFALRAGCVIQASLMASLAVTGVLWPAWAMTQMTGLDRAWDTATVSLMRMHTGSDLVLLAGFLLVAWRPVASLPLFVACASATFGHGLVHLGLAGAPDCPAHNGALVGLLGLFPLVLAALFPWREAFARWRSPATASRVVQGLLGVQVAMLAGIGAFGVLAPGPAMTLLAGQSADWHPATLALMRMHTATDLGVGLGLALAMLAPVTSGGVVLLGLAANLAHAAVHILAELEGGHRVMQQVPGASALPIGLLLLVTASLVYAFPWRAAWQVSNGSR